MFGRKRECKHVATGWMRGTPYAWMHHSVIDGIGRIHGDMYATCDKCGEKFLMCKIHVDHAIRELAKHPITRAEILRILEETK